MGKGGDGVGVAGVWGRGRRRGGGLGGGLGVGKGDGGRAVAWGVEKGGELRGAGKEGAMGRPGWGRGGGLAGGSGGGERQGGCRR